MEKHMNFKLNKLDIIKLENLFKVKYDNIGASELVLELVDDFENGDILSEFNDITSKEAYIAKLKTLFSYEASTSEEKAFFDAKILRAIKKANLDDYATNEYAKAIQNVHFKNDKLLLTNKNYEQNQLFIYDDVNVHGDYYEEALSLAYSPLPFPYLALLENDTIWMAIIPHEINTMKASIEEAQGNVLVLGLGLGYYPFMISLKPEVNKITIVEKNKKIVSIFKEYILPEFKHPEKIEIIEGDAFKVMKEKGHQYDYAFFDIYRSSDDGLLLYVKAKRLEAVNPQLKVAYWLEASMLAHLRRVVITLLEESYYGYESQESTPLNPLFTHIQKKLESVTFNSYQDIYQLLANDSLLTLIK